MCTDEILTNALIHGNGGNTEKKISITLDFNAEKFTLAVKDEGEGFDIENFSRQLKENHLDIPTKRGLFIVEYLMDEISFNTKGNEITATMYLKEIAPIANNN